MNVSLPDSGRMALGNGNEILDAETQGRYNWPVSQYGAVGNKSIGGML